MKLEFKLLDLFFSEGGEEQERVTLVGRDCGFTDVLDAFYGLKLSLNGLDFLTCNGGVIIG